MIVHCTTEFILDFLLSLFVTSQKVRNLPTIIHTIFICFLNLYLSRVLSCKSIFIKNAFGTLLHGSRKNILRTDSCFQFNIKVWFLLFNILQYEHYSIDLILIWKFILKFTNSFFSFLYFPQGTMHLGIVYSKF